MKSRTIVITVFTAALLAASGAVAQKGMSDAHCGAQFDETDVGHDAIDGFVLHRQFRVGDDTMSSGGVLIDGLDITFNVPIPNKLPGFHTLAAALDSSFTVVFSHGRSSVQAKCFVHASRALGHSGDLSYAMSIEEGGGKVMWNGGVCDVDLYTDGLQAGVPVMYHGDTIRAYVSADGGLVEVTSGQVTAY